MNLLTENVGPVCLHCLSLFFSPRKNEYLTIYDCGKIYIKFASLSSIFFMIAVLMGIKWCLIMVLIIITLMISGCASFQVLTVFVFLF